MEFQPPLRKALSEKELEAALTALNSIADSSELIFQQQKLRAEDKSALEGWISKLKTDGSLEASQALTRYFAELFPAHRDAREVDELDDGSEPEPVFTSEINTLRRRRPRHRGPGSLFFYGRLMVTALVLALLNLIILSSLNLSSLDSVIAIIAGLISAHAFALILKTHKLHPLLRSASVFGGNGVYWSSGLLIGALSLFISSGYVDDSIGLKSGIQWPEFRIDLVALGLAVLLITQLSSPGFRSVLPGVILFIGIGWLVTNLSYQVPELGSSISLNSLWAGIAIGLIGSGVLIFGQPHEQQSSASLGFSALSSILFSILGLGFLAGVTEPNWHYLHLTALLSLLSLLVLSGFDLAGRSLGRLAGAAYLLGPLLAGFDQMLLKPTLCVLSCAIVLILFDQLSRRSSLHVDSLNTSHGFYSSFQFWSWSALLVAAVTGFPQFQQLLSSGPTVSSLVLPYVSGSIVGIVFGLIRIPVVLSQDRELKNIEVRDGGPKNLIGLDS